MNVRLLRLLVSSAFGLAYCASALAQNAARLDPQKINSYWILLNRSVDVDIPNGGRNLTTPGCAAVSYTIGSDGIPRDIKVEKQVPDGAFGQMAQSAVSHFRYGPSLSNRASQPVTTYYIVPFNSPDQGAGQQKLMAPCKLPGYDAG